MNPIDLLMKLLRKFVPMDEGEFAKMKEESSDWWSKIKYPEDIIEGDKQNVLLSKVKKSSSAWYFRAMFAVSYLVLVMVITKELRAVNEPDEDDD